MIEAVCGFLFTADRQRVVLIEKRKPAFQAGLLNGVGGHIEGLERVSQAMEREFREETGVGIQDKLWQQFAEINVNEWRVYFFRYFSQAALDVKTMTDEPVHLYGVNEVPYLKVMPNLRWLVPMALDADVRHARVLS